ncbi:NUDIX hydrolase [Paenibacillus silvisoli]|nr:hypothetical protein [Paenibacillus silvisoli]
MGISVGVQAVIMQEDRILAIKKRENADDDITYILPGGKLN